MRSLCPEASPGLSIVLRHHRSMTEENPMVCFPSWTFPLSLSFATNNASVSILLQMSWQAVALISRRLVSRAGLLAQSVMWFFLTVLYRIKQENMAEVTSGRAEEAEQMDPREACWWLSQSLIYKILRLQVAHLVRLFMIYINGIILIVKLTGNA